MKQNFALNFYLSTGIRTRCHPLVFEWLQGIARNLKDTNKGAVKRTVHVTLDELPPFPDCGADDNVKCITLDTPSDLTGDSFHRLLLQSTATKCALGINLYQHSNSGVLRPEYFPIPGYNVTCMLAFTFKFNLLQVKQNVPRGNIKRQDC